MSVPSSNTTPNPEPSRRRNAPSNRQGSRRVTDRRASAQRAKLDAQAEARTSAAPTGSAAKPRGGKTTQRQLQAQRRATTTIERTIEDYLLDHEGGNDYDQLAESEQSWIYTSMIRLMLARLARQRGSGGLYTCPLSYPVYLVQQ